MIVQEKEDKDLNPVGGNGVEEERVRNSQRHQQRAISDTGYGQWGGGLHHSQGSGVGDNVDWGHQVSYRRWGQDKFEGRRRHAKEVLLKIRPQIPSTGLQTLFVTLIINTAHKCPSWRGQVFKPNRFQTVCGGGLGGMGGRAGRAPGWLPWFNPRESAFTYCVY